MTIDQRNLQLDSVRTITLIIAVLLAACSPTPSPQPEIGQGSSKAEVIALFGQPDQIQDFVLPDQPFFGPQESLINLVPAGTVVEEWVYEIGDDLLYVWFTGQDGDSRQDWLVLLTARYPTDTVFLYKSTHRIIA